MSGRIPQDVLEAYVFANTPSYLFRKLMESSYVSGISQQSDDELFARILRASKDDVESIADAYAAVLAILKKNPSALGLEAESPLSRLRWGNDMVALYREKVVPSTVKKVRIPSTLNELHSEKLSASISNTTFLRRGHHD